MLSVDYRYIKGNLRTIRLCRVDLLPRQMPNNPQIYPHKHTHHFHMPCSCSRSDINPPLNHTHSHMPIFPTKNHTVNRMPVFLTENHNVSRILVFSAEIASLVICSIFSTENILESQVLQQFYKTFRFPAITVTLPNMYNWSGYNFEPAADLPVRRLRSYVVRKILGAQNFLNKNKICLKNREFMKFW